MSVAAQSKTSGHYGAKARIPMLVPPLAALIYPFALKGFNVSVTSITASAIGAPAVFWLSAAASLALAFAIPLIALLAAMSFAEIDRPTAAQLRAKRVALLAVAAPTLFTFIGVVLYMLHDPVPDTWFWVACWVVAVTMLLRAENDAPAMPMPHSIAAPLRVAHGASALAIVVIFLALHITNHLTGLAGAGTYDAVMKVFRHVYRTDILQPVLVALFFFQIGSGLFFVWRYTAATSDRFRTFQIASGVYLAFYVLGHMGLGLHLRTHISWHRYRLGLRHRRADRPRQGRVEHSFGAALLARRVLCPLPSCGRGASGHDGARNQQGFRRPFHDQRRYRRRAPGHGDHARDVRVAGCVHLRCATTSAYALSQRGSGWGIFFGISGGSVALCRYFGVARQPAPTAFQTGACTRRRTHFIPPSLLAHFDQATWPPSPLHSAERQNLRPGPSRRPLEAPRHVAQV